MADSDDSELNDLAELAPEELSDELARDIAKRWDPERLLKLVATRAGKGEALDASLRARYEQKLGVDLSHVRVYTGAFAEEFNKQRNADAVTIGGTGMILMGGTTDRPMESASGQALLAHELTHVAQAERGVHRRGRGVDMELATEEHEAEAEQAEAEEMQHQQGGARDDGGARAKQAAAKLEAEVMEKVIAMLGESMRVLVQRSGSPFRRP
ncbi:MAG: DUF4157 domain-containing protein [Kofleriaceae bacterium]|nr:MAG: DUF4157 domain-containing protein [Kofleriaceae bacterium]MBZ0238961.1 DUF4157 domain-containing protein [Kofleriaceae bacterium]